MGSGVKQELWRYIDGTGRVHMLHLKELCILHSELLDSDLYRIQ